MVVVRQRNFIKLTMKKCDLSQSNRHYDLSPWIWNVLLWCLLYGRAGNDENFYVNEYYICTKQCLDTNKVKRGNKYNRKLLEQEKRCDKERRFFIGESHNENNMGKWKMV